MISIQMSKSRCNLFTIEYFSEFKFIFLSIAHMCAFQVLIFWGFSYSFRKFFSHDLSKIIVISILILSNNCFVFHSLSSHFNIKINFKSEFWSKAIKSDNKTILTLTVNICKSFSETSKLTHTHLIKM